ncbi:MAG TPA: D-aminoacyl-tRNA deacylase [Planctomycetota bacterium]
MKALLQRVDWARVKVDDRIVGEIGCGLLVLLGCEKGDTAADGVRLADRLAGYRVFEDAAERTNCSVRDVAGAVLVVSQFTLAADTRKGTRPSFSSALEPESARERVAEVVAALRESGLEVAEGEFGAAMVVELANRGPASYLLQVPPSGA